MKNSKSNKNNQGFTIIEILIVLFFAGILLVVLFNIYDWHGKVYSYQQAFIRVSSANRTAISNIQSYVSQSYRVYSSASVNGITYNTGADTLVLQMPALDTNNSIIFGKWDKVAFYPDGSNFYMQLEPDPSSRRTKINKILSDTLLSVVFIYNDTDMDNVNNVRVTFKSSKQVKDQIITQGMDQSMYLLNY